MFAVEQKPRMLRDRCRRPAARRVTLPASLGQHVHVDGMLGRAVRLEVTARAFRRSPRITRRVAGVATPTRRDRVPAVEYEPVVIRQRRWPPAVRVVARFTAFRKLSGVQGVGRERERCAVAAGAWLPSSLFCFVNVFGSRAGGERQRCLEKRRTHPHHTLDSHGSSMTLHGNARHAFGELSDARLPPSRVACGDRFCDRFCRKGFRARAARLPESRGCPTLAVTLPLERFEPVPQGWP